MEFKIYCFLYLCFKGNCNEAIKKDMSMPAILWLIIHGKRTTMVVRDLCILYRVCLVCHLCVKCVNSTSCFSEKTFLSLTKWMVSKGGGHVLEQHLGFADGYVFFGCLSFLHIMFLLPKILCEDKSGGYNIMHCKTFRRNGELFCNYCICFNWMPVVPI